MLKLNFIIRYDDDDDEVEEFITNYISEIDLESNISVKTIKGSPLGRLNLHIMYNEMVTPEVLESSDFIAIWDDDTIITSDDWDSELCNYYDVLLKNDKEAIACFQLRNKDSSFINPILTSNFVKTVGYISTVPDVQFGHNTVKVIGIIFFISVDKNKIKSSV